MAEIESGIYSINIDSMVKMLSKAYVSLIETATPFKNFPSVMLWGPPGVGKSQGVKQIAEIIQTQTGKRVEVTDVRLLLFNPVDLRGIPTVNEDRTLAVWLKPKIFQMDESESTVNILFLDEISAAPPSVQAAAYQITLDRVVGEHKLPENCIVIAAGNRTTDKSVAFNMPKALANRLCHFEVKGDAASWHDWAVKSGLHPYVVGYLEYNTAALSKSDLGGVSMAFPTPRSWEMVSNILRNISSNIEEVYPMIIGCIGHDTASAFKTWTELYTQMPPLEDIFNGKQVTPPKAAELRIALKSAMVDYVRKNPIKALVDNSIEFACILPWSFRGSLMHDYCQVSQVKEIIEQNEVYIKALKDGLK